MIVIRILIILILFITLGCDALGPFSATSYTTEPGDISDSQDYRQQWIGHYYGNAVTHIASVDATRSNMPFEVVISESGNNKILIEAYNITGSDQVPYFVASIKVKPENERSMLLSATSWNVRGEVNIRRTGNQIIGTIYEYRVYMDGSYGLDWWARINVIRED